MGLKTTIYNRWNREPAGCWERIFYALTGSTACHRFVAPPKSRSTARRRRKRGAFITPLHLARRANTKIQALSDDCAGPSPRPDPGNAHTRRRQGFCHTQPHHKRWPIAPMKQQVWRQARRAGTEPSSAQHPSANTRTPMTVRQRAKPHRRMFCRLKDFRRMPTPTTNAPIYPVGHLHRCRTHLVQIESDPNDMLKTTGP